MISCGFGSLACEKGHGRTPVQSPKPYEMVSAWAYCDSIMVIYILQPINKELDRYIQWTQVEPLTTRNP